MEQHRWDVSEVNKTLQAVAYPGEHPASDFLSTPVETLSAAAFRSRVGTLRGGNTVVIVQYRGKPAAFAVPHPISTWDDSKEFVSRSVSGRNMLMAPPFCEPTHPWATEQTKVEVGPMEDVRRQTAKVFAHVLRNTVYLMTYYDQYEVMSLIPIPPDMPEPMVQIMARAANRLVRQPDRPVYRLEREIDLDASVVFPDRE
jgi:hypothetical protein